MNFKWLVVLCMTMGFATVAKAQIYSSEALFYVKAGNSLLNNPYIEVVFVDNETNHVFAFTSHMNSIEKNGFQYYDSYKALKECPGTIYDLKYDENLSKYGKNVYVRYAYGGLTHMYVFPDDKSSLVIYPRGDENRKEYYIRVDRSKFEVKSESNYDFLYD